MSKTLDQLDFNEIIQDCLNENFTEYDDNYEHETESGYAPYGDTWVRSGEFVTEQSQINCEEAFKQDFDVDYFITEYLQENKDFREKIKEMVEKGKFYKV